MWALTSRVSSRVLMVKYVDGTSKPTAMYPDEPSSTRYRGASSGLLGPFGALGVVAPSFFVPET